MRALLVPRERFSIKLIFLPLNIIYIRNNEIEVIAIAIYTKRRDPRELSVSVRIICGVPCCVPHYVPHWGAGR